MIMSSKKCPECGSDMEYVDSPFKPKTNASGATVYTDKVWKCKNPACGVILRW